MDIHSSLGFRFFRNPFGFWGFWVISSIQDPTLNQTENQK